MDKGLSGKIKNPTFSFYPFWLAQVMENSIEYPKIHER
jgi:hypothetical protein